MDRYNCLSKDNILNSRGRIGCRCCRAGISQSQHRWDIVTFNGDYASKELLFAHESDVYPGY